MATPVKALVQPTSPTLGIASSGVKCYLKPFTIGRSTLWECTITSTSPWSHAPRFCLRNFTLGTATTTVRLTLKPFTLATARFAIDWPPFYQPTLRPTVGQLWPRGFYSKGAL